MALKTFPLIPLFNQISALFKKKRKTHLINLNLSLMNFWKCTPVWVPETSQSNDKQKFRLFFFFPSVAHFQLGTGLATPKKVFVPPLLEPNQCGPLCIKFIIYWTKTLQVLAVAFTFLGKEAGEASLIIIKKKLKIFLNFHIEIFRMV